MAFTLTQTDTLVTGTGTITGTSGAEPMDVIGFVPTIADSTPVVLTFSAENVVPAIFFGALSKDGTQLSGTLTITFISKVDTVAFARQ